METRQLSNLANEYGTPLFVYDGNKIIEQYNKVYDFIKWEKTRVYYAMKANYNVGILQLLRDNNAFLDTVSPGEVHLAINMGFSSDQILYTANNFTIEEMREVREYGVLFNIGSSSELERYGREYPGSDVCLRFNTDIVAGENAKVQTTGDRTKFGILIHQLTEINTICETYNLNVVGVHTHTGSGIDNVEKFLESADRLLEFAMNFRNLEFVDFGGGFKVNYNPSEQEIDYTEFGQRISDRFEAFCREYGRELYMYFEPGKYIVAEAGYLLTEVNTIKNNRGRIIVGTNSGFNHLIRPVLYDAYHHIVNVSNEEGLYYKYDICGNICETGDRFGEQQMVQQINEGDILSIENAGAYCYSMASIYNLRSLPTEIILHNNQATIINKRKTNRELALDIIQNSCIEVATTTQLEEAIV